MAEQREHSPQVAVFDSGPPDQTGRSSAIERQREEIGSADIPNMLEDGGLTPSARSNLHRKFEVRLAEDHLCATGVYLRRWRVETPWFSVRLHHWFASDDDRSMHDHPWDFVTIPLRGSYLDETPSGPQRVRAGRAYYRPATHAHWVHLDRGRVWTLVLTGPKVRRWGFLVGAARKWVVSYRYFYRFGNHPCDDR